MKLTYTERVIKRLEQLTSEVLHASNLDFYDRLRAFKRFCDGTAAIAYCLDQLPKVPYPLDSHWRDIRDQWPDGEKGYAIRWDAITQMVDSGPARVQHVWLNLWGGKEVEALPRITQLFIAPIYNYLVDQLETSNSMLYILLRYKRWAEWFEAEQLRKSYCAEGEIGLDRSLRRFLFESGIDYPYSQPDSPGGRVDIVAGLETDEPLVLEVKVWDSSKKYGENRCRDGLRQVMDYASKYGKDKGYVVVFNLDPEALTFTGQDDAKGWPPRIEYGNKTYYFMDVNIAEQQKPISQQDKGKPVKTNEVRLVDIVERADSLR